VVDVVEDRIMIIHIKAWKLEIAAVAIETQ